MKQQYILYLGKIENGIVAVTAYGLLEGMTFPLIFEVYKPKERLREGQPYLSKPKLAVEMIRYLPKIGLRFKLVLADSLYGESHSTFIYVLNKLFLGVAWYTGERPEAILSVDVNHIYENPAQRQPRNTIIYPGVNRKDNKTREVPTHQALKLMLAAYQPPASGFLFPSIYDNEQHLSRQAIDKAFRIAVKKAGLEHRGFSIYSGRRGFITHLNEQDRNIKTIQSLTGHKSLSSLVQYIDVSDEQRRNAIANF